MMDLNDLNGKLNDLSSKIKEYYNKSEDIDGIIGNFENSNPEQKFNKLSTVWNILQSCDSECLSKENTAVYVGAGYDIEFPLLMGFSKIILIDPVYNSENKTDKERFENLKKKICEKYNGKEIEKVESGKGSSSFSFDFDFKKIIVEFKGIGHEEYIPEEDLGLLIEYRSPDSFIKKHQIIKKLKGLYYSNERYNQNYPENFGFEEIRSFKSALTHIQKIYSSKNITQKDIEKMKKISDEQNQIEEDMFKRVPDY